MTITAKVIADSVRTTRITTLECRYPRFVHSELMTHRVFSRNAASSRAIPIEKMIQSVLDDPAMPIHWGKNQAGMQARVVLGSDESELCRGEWLFARDNAVATTQRLAELGLHKQIANRLLEPFMHITTLVTATEWSGFFAQRLHPDAQPELRELAVQMKAAMGASTPITLAPGEWHTPYSVIGDRRVSVGRSARVSYLTHSGTTDPEKDIALHDKLLAASPPHASPFEHVAQAAPNADRYDNFTGWVSYRRMLGL